MTEQDVLARTIYGEGRGEGVVGMEAVACVILNRLTESAIYKFEHHKPEWWGDSLIEICKKPFQFSCWNVGDPNYTLITQDHIEDRAFSKAMDIADRALNHEFVDITNGATYYHARGITPKWADPSKITAVVGRHIFYHL